MCFSMCPAQATAVTLSSDGRAAGEVTLTAKEEECPRRRGSFLGSKLALKRTYQGTRVEGNSFTINRAEGSVTAGDLISNYTDSLRRSESDQVSSRTKRFKGTQRHVCNNERMHPRSRHLGAYLDYKRLGEKYEYLKPFLTQNRHGGNHLDLRDQLALYSLSKALLMECYGLEFDLPLAEEKFLVPCVPSRANYVHHAADLLVDVELEATLYLELHRPARDVDRVNALVKETAPLRGEGVRILDIGVGANCIYPLLGATEYGWSFVGTDVSERSLAVAQRNVDSNGLGSRISLRHQPNSQCYFEGAVEAGDLFALCMCNPPFHESAAQINVCPVRSLEAQDHELMCEGGELQFIKGMIAESRRRCAQFMWFSSLVARAATIRELKKVMRSELREFRENKKQESLLDKFWMDVVGNRGSGVASDISAPGENTEGDSCPTVNVSEFRCKELYQGKQTRWVMCWTFWTKRQRKVFREFILGARAC
ncbi:23s rrna methyltransferase [Cystoisospora suis]|uniref:23s rrna methyltransferase n=1 Tax=Cystoisospora suis TaxID=483139 RepID=A0A2C6LA49_9APIC|nr:23s rrna methyltransferase [Cystoisospora suis]